MKLYNAISGNTKRVRIFLMEKGVEIPCVEMELGTDTRTAEFRKLNSLGELPVLELDDGRVITESAAICRYLESVFPDPPLMGLDAFEQAHIEMWSLRIHGQIFMTYGNYVRHTIALFGDTVDQVPQFAESQRRAVPEKWAWLDGEMSDGRRFIAGDTFTMADVHGMTALMLADVFKLPVPENCEFANRWAGNMRQRPSWQA